MARRLLVVLSNARLQPSFVTFSRPLLELIVIFQKYSIIVCLRVWFAVFHLLMYFDELKCRRHYCCCCYWADTRCVCYWHSLQILRPKPPPVPRLFCSLKINFFYSSDILCLQFAALPSCHIELFLLWLIIIAVVVIMWFVAISTKPADGPYLICLNMY